jgi:hypothetical protein
MTVKVMRVAWSARPAALFVCVRDGSPTGAETPSAPFTTARLSLDASDRDAQNRVTIRLN